MQLGQCTGIERERQQVLFKHDVASERHGQRALWKSHRLAILSLSLCGDATSPLVGGGRETPVADATGFTLGREVVARGGVEGMVVFEGTGREG